MSDYLLDTNILILCFRKTEGYRELLDTLAKDDILYINHKSKRDACKTSLFDLFQNRS